MSPLVPATVAMPVIALRSQHVAVVVTINDLLGVSAVRAFVFTESVGETFDLTK